MRKFTATKTKPTAKPKELGFILYEGASVLDGAPIVAIATLSTSNRKTGDMVQTWILRSDINPVEASKQKLDGSICGNCPQRQSTGGACYVNIGQAPNSIYKAYKNNRYPKFDIDKHGAYLSNRMIRLGAYGDPAAMPYSINAELVLLASGHTGYTHQIAHKNFDKRYINICMVSADSPKQAKKYQAQGAKTFRVALADDGLFDNELECLSDSKGINCTDCGLCDGQTKNIAIAVHGSRKNNFKSNLIQILEVA
jgi:hypothetical protein